MEKDDGCWGATTLSSAATLQVQLLTSACAVRPSMCGIGGVLVRAKTNERTGGEPERERRPTQKEDFNPKRPSVGARFAPVDVPSGASPVRCRSVIVLLIVLTHSTRIPSSTSMFIAAAAGRQVATSTDW